jgi:hypothetical protein
MGRLAVGRRMTGLAAAMLLAVAAAGAVATARDDGARWVMVRDASGAELARAALPPSQEFALRYRNSVYGSLAEERFAVEDDHLRLMELGADERAVLEEYYAAPGSVRGAAGGRAWSVAVERPLIALPLRVQATALGERTLLTESGEISLWQLVAGRDDTLVLLSIEGSG